MLIQVEKMKWQNMRHQLMQDCLYFYFQTCSATTPFFTFHFSFDDFDTFPVKGAIENWDILVCKSNGTSAVVSEPWQYDEIAVTGKLFAKGKKILRYRMLQNYNIPKRQILSKFGLIVFRIELFWYRFS